MLLPQPYCPTILRARLLCAAAVLGSFALNTDAAGQIIERSGDGAPQAQQSLPTAEQVEKAVAEEEKRGGLIKVSWPSIPAPKITLPEFNPPKINLPWSGEEGESFFAPIEAGARKIGDGTKQAWNGFKGLVSPSSKAKAPKAQSKPKEPFWKRLFTPKEEPQGPQTVGEWMSQPRLDP